MCVCDCIKRIISFSWKITHSKNKKDEEFDGGGNWGGEGRDTIEEIELKFVIEGDRGLRWKLQNRIKKLFSFWIIHDESIKEESREKIHGNDSTEARGIQNFCRDTKPHSSINKIYTVIKRSRCQPIFISAFTYDFDGLILKPFVRCLRFYLHKVSLSSSFTTTQSSLSHNRNSLSNRV